MTTSHLRRAFVAVTAVAALTLAGCGEDEPAETTTNSSDSPAASDSPTAEPKKPKAGKSSEPSAPEETVIEVTINGGEVTPKAEAVELGVGETLVLQIDADRGGELHVHSSPEQMVEFQANTSRIELSFDKPGSVDIEEHESGALIARVLVQ